MANTYTQIHIQVVFTVRNRECIISSSWENDLFRYITGIIQNNQHKVLAINGMPDHVHILFGMRPIQSLSDLMQDVKGDSSKWINQNHFIREHFSWQEGYGAFSYSKSQISNVIDYINKQETHHSGFSFTKEYLKMLQESEILYDDRFLFIPVEYDTD
jgi:putative transposase